MPHDPTHPLFVYGPLREGERNAGRLERITGGPRSPAQVRGTLVTLGQGGPVEAWVYEHQR